MLVYKPVHSGSCYSHWQRDINNIFQWSQDNLMTFNTSKCKCMLLTNKRSIFPPTLTLNNQPLELVQQMKYLALIVSHNLSWSQHIQATCKKARKMLGIIYRQFCSNNTNSLIALKLYLALVRPHLEYAVQVLNPHLVKDIRSLENVQQFGLRICLKNYHVSYEFLLDFFKIPSLQNRRLFLSLCTFYSILKNLVSFPRDCVFPSVMPYFRSRHYNPNAYRLPLAHCNGLSFSCFYTVVSVWNNLPTQAVTATTLPVF